MRLLDLYCGAGGAAKGYADAGFTVLGVDIKHQPRYPFAFVQDDALSYLAHYGHDFDAIHASPPCQAYSNTRRLHTRAHPDLIARTRAALQHTGKPYVIENVPGAPLLNPTTLVGTMFGLLTLRPRLFECSFPVPFALAPPPATTTAKMGRRPQPNQMVHAVGHLSDIAYCRTAMGIDWMTRDELAQAIPPAYTAFISHYLKAATPP